MRLFNKIGVVLMVPIFFMSLSPIYAATSPDLGIASTFGILASTYTNTAGGTTINGDLGYTTGPATAPTVSGTTYVADSTYTQAGAAQGSALTALNNQPCTFTFAPGAIDLSLDTTHGPIGVYEPGVYCIAGAGSIGTGITLDGEGTYIFRMTGAFNTAANSSITMAGASACDVWWTPIAATTLGADSTLVGTVIDDAGITIGNNVTWSGRALAFAGTVSTASDTISVPTCLAATPTPTPTPTAIPTSTSGSGSQSQSSTSTPSPTLTTTPTSIVTTIGTPGVIPGLPNTSEVIQGSNISRLGFLAIPLALLIFYIVSKNNKSQFVQASSLKKQV